MFIVHAQPRSGNNSNTGGNTPQRRGIVGRVTQTVRNVINRVRGGNTATTRTRRGRG